MNTHAPCAITELAAPPLLRPAAVEREDADAAVVAARDDPLVVEAHRAHKVAVRDVPGFSFENRPWRHNNQIRLISKQHALRSDKRDAQNARCHDALVRRDDGAHAHAAAVAAVPARRQRRIDTKVTRRIHMRRNDTSAHITAEHATAKHAKRRNSIRHQV